MMSSEKPGEETIEQPTGAGGPGEACSPASTVREAFERMPDSVKNFPLEKWHGPIVGRTGPRPGY